MSTEIYYFSGTGNCLYTARMIGTENNFKVISIPQFLKSSDNTVQAERIIIVFPSYLAAACGVPLIVERFVRAIEDIELKKITAVCTCGGYEIVNANPSLIKLKKIIESAGGRLETRFSLRLPMNNLDYEHIPVPIEKRTEHILTQAESKLQKISKQIGSSTGGQFEISNTLFNFIIQPLFKIMKNATLNSLRGYAEEVNPSLSCNELLPLTDRRIKVKENCNGCGVCARICPVENIELINGSPQFMHKCEVCFACDEWCPQGAIQHWGRSRGVKYHHPKIKINDMF